MAHQFANRRDLEFLLYEVLRAEELCDRERYAEHNRETFDAALDTAYRIAEDLFVGHNAKADAQEPQFDGERVHMIPEVKTAVDALCASGFLAAGQDYELGGMQLPLTISQACLAFLKGANVSTTAYVLLTGAASNLLLAHGSPEQIERYVQPMLEGRFFGTMVLTEPQAGSSLGDIRTTAAPQDDGTYRLSGNKIFISGGDHELSENIVHLVLAKIPGGQPGVKGISLFIVPKYLLDDEGRPAQRNDVSLGGLIHKMGYRGTTSTMLNFGERGECVGYLVGEPHQGLRYMFHMMNEARIGVGLGAAMLGYAGYLESLAYARGRAQGRPLASKDPSAPPVPLVRHPDVRRMLLTQKAYVEGALALCLYSSRLADDKATQPSPEARREAALLLDLVTPIAKAWPSHFCVQANDLAIQVFGGYGYTREYPVEQLYRDNRLNPIHEGTNGIQAMDLLGRKVAAAEGAGLQLLASRIRGTCDSARAAGDEAETWAEALETLLNEALETTAVLRRCAEQGDPERALADAWQYLHMLGHAVVAWLWLEQALVAVPHTDDPFYRGKVAACRHFFYYDVATARQLAVDLRRLDSPALAADPECL